MSTEPQPPATPPTTPTPAAPTPAPATNTPAEPNALSAGLSNFWTQFKAGQLVSYRLMALLLVAVAGIGTYVYISRSNRKAESAKWTELDLLAAQGSVPALEEFAKKNPDDITGRVASLQAAHQLLGQDGLDLLPVTEEKRRPAVVANVQKARDEFGRLADVFKDVPDVRAQCLHARAKAEVALVGLLKPGSLDKYYGDPKAAAAYLDEAAEAFPETELAKSCKKLAEALRNPKADPSVVEVQRTAYIGAGARPAFDPKSPFGGPGLGGLPGGIGGIPGGPVEP